MDDGIYCRGCGVLMHAAREMAEAAEHISASLVCPECGYGHLLTCQYAQVGTYFDGEGRYEPTFAVQG